MNIIDIIKEEIEQFDWGKEKVADRPIKPNEFIYHSSDINNREGILRNGLELRTGDNYLGYVGREKKAIPAIFATATYNDVTGGMPNTPEDIWEINTRKIDNEWFADKHFSDFGLPNNPHMVTFKNIPANALKLVHKGYDYMAQLRQKQNMDEDITSQYIHLQRCQTGEVNNVWDFNVVNGQNGEGIYAFLAGDKPMKDYYCKNGENIHSFKIEKKYIKDLSNLKLDYWDVKKFIYNNSQYKAFIFKHVGHGIPSSKEVLITDPKIIILDNSDIMNEEYNHTNYLKWKRQNVTLRGVRNNVGTPNSEDDEGNFLTAFGDVLGKGLYTAALSNKGMAKQYGKVYYVLNAIPKHPMVFNTLNDWQIWFGNTLVGDFTKQRGANYPDKRIFNAETTIEKEMMKRSYDGIIIRGREMVNFTPPDNVLYFSTEQELMNYYEIVIENNV